MRYIVWLDDEITSLKPLITLLEETGSYKIYQFSNVEDFLSFLQGRSDLVDVIILDEHIGYESGLDVYDRLRNEFAISTPVIFITREENSDYIRELIARGVHRYISKPVKFSDLVATITQITEGEVLQYTHLVSQIPKQFRKIHSMIEEAESVSQWHDVISALIQSKDILDRELFEDLYDSAQTRFFKFFEHAYEDIVNSKKDHLIVNFLDRHREFLLFDTLVLVIDNFSLWLWNIMRDKVKFPEEWALYKEEFLLSLLPTVTQYSRQSMLSGLFPIEIKELGLWVDEMDDEVKTKYEPEIVKLGFEKKKLPSPTVIYFSGEETYSVLRRTKGLVILIVPSFDQLIHLATDHKSLREIFRSVDDFAQIVIRSFSNGMIRKILEEAMHKFKYVLICSDHGSVSVKTPVYTSGRHFMPLNPRYKYGEDFKVEEDDFITLINDPTRIKLPIPKNFKMYIAGKDRFFVRKHGNYKEIVQRFKNSLQHGGISLEEVFVPVVILKRKF